MLEAQIEKRVCDYAKDKGLLVYKFTSPNRSSVPDRLMITPKGSAFFIEFKREGQKPTPSQEREHTKLRGHNIAVFVVDNVDQGKQLIEQVLFRDSIGCKP